LRVRQADGVYKDSGFVTPDLRPFGTEVQLSAPIVGLVTMAGARIDSIGFVADLCYCQAATPVPLPTTNDMTFSLGQVASVQEVSLPSPLHDFDADFTTVCGTTFGLAQTAPGLTLSGTTLTLDTGDPLNVGTHSAQLSLSIDESPTSPALSSFSVTINPTCSFSPITQAAPLTDMNIDLFGTATQTLPTYSHQFKSTWDTSGVPYSCPIVYRLEAGSSPLVSLTGSTLTLTTDDPSQVGSHTATITAFFDGVAGGEHSQTITLIVSGGSLCQDDLISQTTALVDMSIALGETTT